KRHAELSIIALRAHHPRKSTSARSTPASRRYPGAAVEEGPAASRRAHALAEQARGRVVDRPAAPAVSGVKTTPQSLRAAQALTLPWSTSRPTGTGSRASGSLPPPRPVVPSSHEGAAGGAGYPGTGVPPERQRVPPAGRSA